MNTARIRFSDSEILSHVLNEIKKISGPKRNGKKYIDVVCPFHNDHSPSCGIRVSQPASYAPIGSFKCLSCGASGGWNKIASRLGLQKLDYSKMYDTKINFDVSAFDKLLAVQQDLNEEELEKKLHVTKSESWPDKEWRGFDPKIIQRLDGKLVECSYKNRIEQKLLFPVRVNDRLVGGFVAVLEKEKGKKKPSYLNMQGQWSKTQGLFPYDYVRGLLTKRKKRGENLYVVLVEGPRDALRLIKLGIPALCLFGTNGISEQKCSLIAALDVNIVWVLGDGDEAGHLMNSRTVKMLGPLVKTKAVRIPITKDSYDPCSLPDSMMKRLISKLETKVT